MRTFMLLLGTLAFSLQAATITVNSTDDALADTGFCTLREAIFAANTNAASGVTSGECAAGNGSDTIEFSVAGTIQPGSELPIINSVVHIDGYTAPGASKNTQILQQGTNAVLKIEIDGVSAGIVHGLTLSGPLASGSIIEGLAINNSANSVCCNQIGIFLADVSGAATTVLRGNFIGTNLAGTERRPKGSAAIYLVNAKNVVIGSEAGDTFDFASVNLISGNNGPGITTTGGVTSVLIRGNLIGTNAAGAAALENLGDGIGLDSASAVWVSDNVISGNRAGVHLRGVSSDVHIERNIIGRNAGGFAAVPNNGIGIFISENFFGFPDNNITNVDVVDNLVADNFCLFPDCAGILIGAGNAGNLVKGIRLSGNRVFQNQGLEIDLGQTKDTNDGLTMGVTENDPDDPDTGGGNNLQNFPVITTARPSGNNVTIGFTLDSEASKTFTLEFFYTTICDSPGDHGGAEQFLGGTDVATDASGDASGQVVLNLNNTQGYINATATNAVNGTSEFSACKALEENFTFENGFEDAP